MVRIAPFLVCVAVLSLSASAYADGGFLRADRPRDWEFPRDHGSHPEFQIEWWYFTGSVTDASDRDFGFELTFFRFGLSTTLPPESSPWRARDLVLGHFAVTDVDGERFFLSEKTQRAAAGLAGADRDSLRVFLEDWTVRARGDTIELRAGSRTEHFAELELVPTRGPILHGENGLSWKSADESHASYYYSMPRLRTRGRIVIEGRTHEVQGTTWMDHEFFTGATPVEGVGWDWFSCRLDDGRDLMLYLLRYPEGSFHRSGTLVGADGSTRGLRTEGMTLEPLRRWTSGTTGTTYPVDWRIVLPEEELELLVRARLDAQEVHAEETVGFGYWEGLSTYEGTLAGTAISGEGYVELTGYE